MVLGQSVFLQSGQEGLLAETVDGSIAVIVVTAGGKATVVKETTKGKRTALPLSSLKDVEGVAALAAGKGRGGKLNGAALTREVNYGHVAPEWISILVNIIR